MTRVAAAQLRTCRPQLAAVIAWPGRLVESRSQRVRTLVLISGRPRSTPRPICSTAEQASPAASGPGHSWVEVRPTTSGVRWWPSDQPRQPACSGYRPKVQDLGCANGQVESGSGADVPAAGIRDGGSTHPIKPRSIVMRTPQSHTAQENLPSRSALEDRRMPVQAKLAAAWTSLMFLYIYVDYLHLYKPGTIDDIL